MADCDSMDRFITQTRSRVFQILGQAFECIRGNQKLVRVLKISTAFLCYNTVPAVPVSHSKIQFLYVYFYIGISYSIHNHI